MKIDNEGRLLRYLPLTSSSDFLCSFRVIFESFFSNSHPVARDEPQSLGTEDESNLCTA